MNGFRPLYLGVCPPDVSPYPLPGQPPYGFNPGYPVPMPFPAGHLPETHHNFAARPPYETPPYLHEPHPSFAARPPYETLPYIPEPNHSLAARPPYVTPPYIAEPNHSLAARPPQETLPYMTPSTSSRYLFPPPNPTLVAPPSPAPSPPPSTYGQPTSNIFSAQSVSRPYLYQYPSASVQDHSTSLDVLATSGYAPTAPVGYWNQSSESDQRKKNVVKAPSCAILVKPDLGIASIQQLLSGIEPLDDSNYVKWRSQIDITLGHLDYDMALLEPEPNEPLATAPVSVKEKYRKWGKANRMCIMIIRGSLSETIRGGIPDTHSAKELMDIIEKRFGTKRLIGTTISQLCTMKFDGQGSVREHILQMENLSQRLRDLKMEINGDFLVHMALNSLTEVFNAVQVKYYSTEQKWDVDELIAQCVEAEVKLEKENVSSSTMQTLAANKTLLQSETEKVSASGRKEVITVCFSCGVKGHKAFNCPLDKDENGLKELIKVAKRQQHRLETLEKRRDRKAEKSSVEIKGLCGNCGGRGHIAKECIIKEMKNPENGNAPDSVQEKATEGKTEKSLVENRLCYKCGGSGHMAVVCPNKRKNPENGYGPDSVPTVGKSQKRLQDVEVGKREGQH